MNVERDEPPGVVRYALVHTARHGALQVRLPPELRERDIIRVSVGRFADGMTVVNLYTRPDYGYAYNVDCPEFSEWGHLPPEEGTT